MSSSRSPFDSPGPMQVFQQYLDRGTFTLQQCKECGRHVFYPRVLCDGCGSPDMKWVEASGRGRVYSTSVVRRRPEDGPDYNVALIELEEGPRMMSTVVDKAPEEVRIGMKVGAHVSLIDGVAAVVFSSKEQGSQEW